MSTTPTLLPCPFCGLAPHLEEGGTVTWIVCPDESPCKGSQMAFGFRSANAEQAIAAWNRRAALTQGDGEAAEPFGYWHQGATEEESDFFKHGDMGNVGCEKCITLYPAPPAQQIQQAVARAPYLQPDDMAALERLDECFEDGQEYDVSKPAMQRLAELGAVRHHSAGRYSITTFGRIVLGNHLYRFPLETLDECNDRLGREAAAIRAKGTHD